MNYLAIDYGSRRWGLAHGDELALAFPLPAAIEPEEADRWRRVEDEIKKRRIHALVVGYPLNMDGSEGFKAQEVDTFIGQLEARFGLPVHRADERLTSFQAEDELYALGLKPRNDRDLRAIGLIDSRAAAIFLQDFLEDRHPPPAPEWEEDDDYEER